MAIKSEQEFLDAVLYLSSLIRLEDKIPIFEFTGGEPSQIPYFGKVLQATRGNIQPMNYLVTNGSGTMEWWEEVAPFFRIIEISYHPQYADINHIIKVYRYLKSIDDAPDVKVRIHMTNDDQLWLKGVAAYEHLKMLFIKCDLKLMYSNFMQGNKFYPYKTYQLEYYYHTIGKKFNPAPTEYVDKSIPPRRRRHDIDHQTLAETSFDFSNMFCNAGVEQLVVNDDGDVFKGWCKTEGSVGNVFERTVVLPTEPILCTQNYCRNGFDRQATKFT